MQENFACDLRIKRFNSHLLFMTSFHNVGTQDYNKRETRQPIYLLSGGYSGN